MRYLAWGVVALLASLAYALGDWSAVRDATCRADAWLTTPDGTLALRWAGVLGVLGTTLGLLCKLLPKDSKGEARMKVRPVPDPDPDPALTGFIKLDRHSQFDFHKLARLNRGYPMRPPPPPPPPTPSCRIPGCLRYARMGMGGGLCLHHSERPDCNCRTLGGERMHANDCALRVWLETNKRLNFISEGDGRCQWVLGIDPGRCRSRATHYDVSFDREVCDRHGAWVPPIEGSQKHG